MPKRLPTRLFLTLNENEAKYLVELAGKMSDGFRTATPQDALRKALREHRATPPGKADATR
jgi:hypothetical protein